MQAIKAAKKSREWGDKSCNHPKIEKEYYLGADTGDYVCTTCGLAMPENEWDIHKSGKSN